MTAPAATARLNSLLLRMRARDRLRYDVLTGSAAGASDNSFCTGAILPVVGGRDRRSDRLRRRLRSSGPLFQLGHETTGVIRPAQELGRALVAPAAHGLAEVRVGLQGPHRLGGGAWVVERDHEPALAPLDQIDRQRQR